MSGGCSPPPNIYKYYTLSHVSYTVVYCMYNTSTEDILTKINTTYAITHNHITQNLNVSHIHSLLFYTKSLFLKFHCPTNHKNSLSQRDTKKLARKWEHKTFHEINSTFQIRYYMNYIYKWEQNDSNPTLELHLSNL